MSSYSKARIASASAAIPLAAGVFAVAVFVIDTLTTLDIAIAVLYVVVVLISANHLSRRGVAMVAACCLTLTVTAYLLSHGLTTGNALLRCLVSLSAIAITSVLALRNLTVNAELRDSERRYRHVFETAGVSIWEQDFSRVKAAIDDLEARGVRDVAAYIAEHPEFVRQAIDLVRVVDVNSTTLRLLGARSKEELIAARRKLFTAETEDAFGRALAAMVGGSTFYSAEASLNTVQGAPCAVLFTVTMPPGSSRWDSVLLSLIDVTERNRTQEALHRTQAELAHITRVTTLGELTASIAHEVNQPLAAMVTNAEACLRWLDHERPNMDEARGAIDRIIRDGTRASDVIWRIRALAQKAESERTPIELNDLIADVLPLVRREVLSQRVALRLELAPGVPRIAGDRVQLQQVMVNLLVNAVQAMASVEDRPRRLTVRTRRTDDGQVRVAVEDTGVGFGTADTERLFDAFYTTKGSGMGMGLSICRSIVEAHGGRVTARANTGPGSTFEVTLPAIEDGAR
ncbi:MAG TPA: ATP-binding protein [Alphaproteobacteria bacterium]|jgi:signal transduction histidine kinase|nr:ATP-binding protein [Alphaproteobacteria bacterium]